MKKWLKPHEDFSQKIQSDFFCCVESNSGESWVAWEGSNFEIEALCKEVRLLFNSNTLIRFIGKTSSINMFKKIFNQLQLNNIKYIVREKSFEIIYLQSIKKFRLSVEEVVENKKIKVLLVDDSKTILTIISTMLKSDTQIEIVGMLTNPLDALKVIAEKKPDVITLDIHMPEMNGVELLKLIQKQYSIPSIMITSLNINEGGLVLDALENGAFDYFQKPKMEDIVTLTPVLIEKIKAASTSNNKKSSSVKSEIQKNLQKVKFSGDYHQQLIVLGASTGGTNALADLLQTFPKEVPPIVIVQHIPPIFSAAFAKRLNELCSFEVKESEDGDILRPNLAIVAKGGVQLKVIQKNGKLVIAHTDDPPVNRFKPSVDYLFDSVALLLSQKQVAAALLTGMGNDGAKGMLNLKNKGVETIAQDENTCVVFGMPREAIELGGATYVEPLLNIGHKLAEILQHRKNIKAKAS